MRRPNYKFYLLLTLFIFLLFNFSFSFSSGLRRKVAFLIAPLVPKGGGDPDQELVAENSLLRQQIEMLQEILLSKEQVDRDMEAFERISRGGTRDPLLRNYLQRRKRELARILDLELKAMPAKVIYRDPAAWGNSLWINVGEKTNRALGLQVVSENSPVVFGRCLIGVIEEVGKTQSRVRLITDPAFNPSVRALRGGEADRFVSGQIAQLKSILKIKYGQESGEIEELLKNLYPQKTTYFLSKGEAVGKSPSMWKKRLSIIRVEGINYNTPDAEGHSSLHKRQLLKEGDLLVTTGLDGVFPPGLYVGMVSEIFSKSQGDDIWDCHARLAAGDLNHLSTVSVLPPINL